MLRALRTFAEQDILTKFIDAQATMKYKLGMQKLNRFLTFSALFPARNGPKVSLDNVRARNTDLYDGHFRHRVEEVQSAELLLPLQL